MADVSDGTTREILWSGNIVLPAPTSLSVNDEIIWTSDTGRTLSGYMTGDVVAEKKNLSIKWEFLTEKEVQIIKSRLIAGFFPLSFRDDGINMTITAYRGTMSKEHLGDVGDGNYYYRSVTVDVIQR